MGFNIKGFVGVLLVYLSLPLIILQMKTWFSHYLDSLRRIIEIFIK
jgi:flagellar biosynthesis protein FliR